MEESNPTSPLPKLHHPKMLSDLVVRYDMKSLAEIASEEYNIKIVRTELITQKSIGQLFNLKERLSARNKK